MALILTVPTLYLIYQMEISSNEGNSGAREKKNFHAEFWKTIYFYIITNSPF